MTDYTSIQVWADHAIPVGKPSGEVTVTLISGAAVYYGDRQVSASSNLGTLANVGDSITITVPSNWLRSASSSQVSLTLAPVAVSGRSVQTRGFSLPSDASPDVVAMAAISSINPFLAWLAANNVKGAISEIGIPNGTDAQRWARVAESYLSILDDLDLPVLQWTDAGNFNAFPGLISGAVSAVDDSAMPIIRHSRNTNRGFMAGGVVGISPPAGFCNVNNQTASNWRPTPDGLQAIADTGVELVRISTRWEVIQPTLAGALNAVEVARLTSAISSARAAGLSCVLDVHNYASYIVGPSSAPVTYHLGDGNLTVAHLVDLWTKLSTTFKANAGVAAYELMNEPANMPGGTFATTANGGGTIARGATLTVASTAAFTSGRNIGLTMVTAAGLSMVSAVVASGTTFTIVDYAGAASTWLNGAAVTSPQLAWEAATQSVVTAIRANTDTTPIWVGGYYFQKAGYWTVNHPVAWITDSASATRYTAHNYWSSSASGDSAYQAWATEVAALTYGGGGGYFALPGRYPDIRGHAEDLPLQAGEAVTSRLVTGTTNALQTGVMFLTTFVARRSEAITKLTVYTTATSAAATPTICRLAVFSVNPDQSLVLIASTANDTTLFSAPWTAYQRTLSAPFYKQAGGFYAVGVLVVSAFALPTLAGSNAIYDATVWPWPCLRMYGLSNVPLSIARGASGAGSDIVYCSMVP